MIAKKQIRAAIGAVGVYVLLLTPLNAEEHTAVADSSDIQVTAETFRCVTEMIPVRHFFVDNLIGNLEGTLEIANSEDGGVYPPGSVVQLVPTEVMVKHGEGWNAATRDWEFFELDVTSEGSAIRNRGFVDVVNRFGGNCFACHIKARPEWDLICEKDHGCEPLPVTAEQILHLQQSDPRCAADVGQEGSSKT